MGLTFSVNLGELDVTGKKKKKSHILRKTHQTKKRNSPQIIDRLGRHTLNKITF